MTKILLIGYGNTLRGDDALGYMVAQQMAEKAAPNVQVIARHQLLPELAEPISKVDFVIFVDAAEGEIPGELCYRTLAKNTYLEISGIFTHASTPNQLLAAAQHLYGKSPEAAIFSITGLSFKVGETLSPQIQAIIPYLIDYLEALIARQTEPV